MKKLYESGGAFSEKTSVKRWTRKRSGISVEELRRNNHWSRSFLVEREDKIRLSRHRNNNSKTTRLQKISGKKRWSAIKRPRNAIQTRVRLLQNIIEPLVDFLREKAAAARNYTTEVTCKTTGTGKSTANDESYDDSAATTEWCIFECCEKLLTVYKWSAIEVFFNN